MEEYFIDKSIIQLFIHTNGVYNISQHYELIKHESY